MSDTTEADAVAPDAAAPGTPEGDTPKLEIMGSRQFPNWLGEQKISLAFTTYQSGKLFLIGLQPDGRLSIFERTFNRCMGLWASDQTLFMSSLYQLWRFENAFEPGQSHDGFDRLYVPQMAYTTGDLDIHDIAVDKDGKIVFVATLFGCLATASARRSFIPVWHPPFISKLAAEDRCHLNGLAMVDGEPGYVTAVSATDVVDGWREKRRDGGIVMDVRSEKIVGEGLSMPHSPRWYRDQLYLCDSGSGHFGRLDLQSGEFEKMAFCPGYLRGLACVGDFAIVGLSKCRENRTFSGLALDDNMASRGAEPSCGLMVIDLRNGDIVHWLRIDGLVEELYDVVVLPGVSRPMALGFKTDEIRRTLSVGDPDETDAIAAPDQPVGAIVRTPRQNKRITTRKRAAKKPAAKRKK